MPSIKEGFERLLSATLKLDDTQAAALYTDADRETLTDDAVEKLEGLFAKHIDTVKTSVKSDGEEQFKYGERKANDEWRKAVKALGIKTDKKDAAGILSDLMATRGSTTLTEDDLKKHPSYLSLEQELLKAKESAEEAVKAAIAQKDAEHQRDRINARVREQAETFLMTMKPVLSKDPAKAKNQLAVYLNEVTSHQYQVDDSADNAFLLLDKSGKRLEDKLGHPVKPQDIWKDIGNKYYDFETTTERSALGNPDKGGAAKKPVTVELPKDPDERAAVLFKINRDPSVTPEQRAEILKAAQA